MCLYFGLQPQTAGGGEQRVTVPAGAGGESGAVRRGRQRRRVCRSGEGYFRQHSVPPGHAHPQPKVPDHRLVVVEVPCFVTSQFSILKHLIRICLHCNRTFFYRSKAPLELSTLGFQEVKT